MGETPTVGDVRVVLKLDTDEAKKKVAEVEKQLQKNEKDRRNIIDRINKEGLGATPNGGRTGKTVGDRLLDKVLPRPGGYNPQINTGTIGKFIGLSGSSSPGNQAPLTPNQAGAAALRAVAGKLNPFPAGGVSGDSVGNVAPTIALATAIYGALSKTSKFAGLGMAYSMKSGDASVKTPAGQFLNDLNSAFSYVSNYAGSYKDAAQRLDSWDDAVASVTGKLPDTQFYLPKFQRQSLFERQFADMRSRNAALTRAGASGASSIADQLGDAAAQSMSR